MTTCLSQEASPNRVTLVTKLPNGDLQCQTAAGKTFTVAAEEELMQAQVIWSMLSKETP